MYKKIALLLIIAILVSGCVFNGNSNKVIPQTNLPYGFTYLGTHETEVNINGISMNATEGVYRHKEGYFRIQVIKDDNPERLLAQYKLQYKNVKYSPFKEISFNGHKATMITDYSIRHGKQVPLYTVIWANKRYLFIVTSEEPTDSETVIALAAATGM